MRFACVTNDFSWLNRVILHEKSLCQHTEAHPMRIQGNIRRLTHLVSCVGSMRWSHLVLSAVMFGVLIRIIHFGFGRMLWLDEATIAINFVTRDGFEHFLAQEFRQIAPPLWMIISDGFWSITGSLEYGARLPSLLAGLAAFLLFWKMTRERFSDPVVFITVFVFAFAYMPVYYSAEVKPYAFDLLFGTVLLHQGLRLLDKDEWPLIETLLFGASIVVTSSLALAAPMIIGGFGTIIGLKAVHGRRWRSVTILVASGVIAAIIYAVPAFSTFQTQVDQSGLDQGAMGHYFNRHYAPFPPTSIGDIGWYIEIVHDTLSPIVGTESSFVYIVMVIIGSIIVARQSLWRFAFMIAPMAIALFLSAAHIYPIMSRLTLYAYPIALMMAGFAFERLRTELPNRENFIVCAAILLMSIGSVTWHRYYNTFNPSASPKDISVELRTISKEIRPDEIIVVSAWSLPAYLLYRNAYDLDHANWTVADRAGCFFETPIDIETRGRVWFLRGPYEGPGPTRSAETYDLVLNSEPIRIDLKTIDQRLDRLKIADPWARAEDESRCPIRNVQANLLMTGRPPLVLSAESAP